MFRLGGGDHCLDASHHTLRQYPVASAKNFRMVGGENILGAEEHLFIELFAGPHSSEPDFDIGSDREAGESDQIGGDIDNSNGLTHVEEENFASATESASLEHQLNGLRDCHEVALHLRVGDCYGPTGAYLTQEGWNDAAATAKNIAKPHGHEITLVLHCCMLDDQLGNPLGCAHHACRADRFVGR